MRIKTEHFERPMMSFIGIPMNGGRSPGYKPGLSFWSSAAFYANVNPIEYTKKFAELTLEYGDESWKFTNAAVATDPMVKEAPYRFMIVFEKCERLAHII